MQHPLFENRNNITYYLLVWVIVSVLHFFLIQYYFDFPNVVMISDSVVSNILASIMGLSLWFSLRYGVGNSDKKVLESLAIQLLSALVLISMWIGFTYFFQTLIFSSNEAYLTFFKASIIYRYVGGLLIYSVLVLFYYVIILYQKMQEKGVNEHRLNMLIKEAEIENLKTQLNPHFLFNSLNSISSLTLQNPEKAQEMVISLSELLRYSVNGSKHKLIEMSQELDTIRKYVSIEKIRFGEKLQVNFDIDENCYSFLVPPMIIQPLVENAVKYGKGQSGGASTIDIRVQVSSEEVQISIRNNYNKEFVNDVGEGIGLRNIQKRLAILYEQNFSFKTHDTGKTFEAVMIIPNTKLTEDNE